LHEDEKDDLIKRYVNSVVREIKSRSEYHGANVNSVYFGGGTPSIVSPSLIDEILSAVHNCYNVECGAEITIEFNPEDIIKDKISCLLESGITRCTLGVQSVSPRMHSLIGRRGHIVTPETMQMFMDIKNVDHCIDLITAIPTQKRSDLLHDIQLIEKYRPEHVSAYMLAIEKGTPLFSRLKNRHDDEVTQRDNYYYFLDQCIKMGYQHYEISNFAIPGHESRHNMKYWKFQPYIGFGVTAHTFYNGERYYNNQSIEEYQTSGTSVLIKDDRSKNQMVAEYIMTSLRLVEGFSEDDFEEIFNENMPDSIVSRFDVLSDEKLIAITVSGSGKRYNLTRDGLCMLDDVVFRVVEPLL
jgi:oxygen-independent coproporphyrinogen-3 oxidase